MKTNYPDSTIYEGYPLISEVIDCLAAARLAVGNVAVQDLMTPELRDLYQNLSNPRI